MSRDPASLRMTWHVRMYSLSLSILRVLANILLGRGLDVLDLRTAAPMQAGSLLLQELPTDYPQVLAIPGFEIDYQGLDSGSGWLVLIKLTSDPDDPVLDSLCQLPRFGWSSCSWEPSLRKGAINPGSLGSKTATSRRSSSPPWSNRPAARPFIVMSKHSM